MKKLLLLSACSLLLFTGCGEQKENDNSAETAKIRECCLEAAGTISDDNTCSFSTSVSDKSIYDKCMAK